MSVFYCGVGSLNAATMPPALQPDKRSVPAHLRDSPFPSRIIFSSIPIFKLPSWVSYHHSLSPWLCDSAHCPLHWIHSINNWAHLSRPPSPVGQTPIHLITVCSRWQTLELGVGLWHPPGILLPSHCPPTG